MRSILLVVGQFTCIAFLLFGGGWALSWWAWALFILGWVLFFWALLSMGVGNFTIMPEPRERNELSVRGIYRFLRHPMYTTVILCGLALALGEPSVPRWAALVVCVPVLVLKVRHEERLLTLKHPDYPERMRGVARLMPEIW